MDPNQEEPFILPAISMSMLMHQLKRRYMSCNRDNDTSPAQPIIRVLSFPFPAELVLCTDRFLVAWKNPRRKNRIQVLFDNIK